MGGRAFAHHLLTATFPRLPTPRYAHIQRVLHARLAPLYARVATPREAPEKPDHGDVDFVVVGPTTTASLGTDADADVVREALGAVACVYGRTSNFAVPLRAFEPEEEEDRYVQVDVNVCEDVEEWERVVFFHGHGDLGMILGILARSVRLHMGEKGLKIASEALAPTYSTSFQLSSSFEQILPFFGLSMDRWRAGFSTRTEVFEWVATSRFYDLGYIHDSQRRAKRRVDRSMYQAFMQWSEARGDHGDVEVDGRDGDAVAEKIMGEALVYFGKKDEYDRLVRENARRVRLKQVWNGRIVGEWTGWTGWYLGRLMKHVRHTVGEDRIAEMCEEELKEAVMVAKEEVERATERERAEAEALVQVQAEVKAD